MIEKISRENLKEAVDMVNEVFAEFVATGYSEEGKKTFYDYVEDKYDELLRQMTEGTKYFWGSLAEGRVNGVIAMNMREDAEAGIPLHPHVSLLFVKKEFHRKGIAGKLFEKAKEEMIRAAADPDETAVLPFEMISVNSSPYAVAVYQRLGFEPTDGEQELNGICFVPMRRRMSAQELQKQKVR